MQKDNRTLEDFRREIDGIDDALHDLLIRRAEASHAIARIKQDAATNGNGASAMRPAREAAILRRLLNRGGGVPARVIVRIWREIISSSLRMQAKFHLHVFAGDNASVYYDLARAYFGSVAPIRTHTKASLVVHACAEEPGSFGIVPLPEIEAAGPAWWAQLAPAGERGPRVIAKLPFVADGDETPAAYAIGAVEQEASGDDTTLLMAEIAPGLSRTKFQTLLKEVGLDARLVAAGRIAEKNVPDEILVEVKGFIGKSDPKLQQIAETPGDFVARIAPIGGYANPVVAPANAS